MRLALRLMSILVIALAACTETKPEPGAADLTRAESLRPANKQLAERYERSCMTCHVVRGSGAPLAGFAPQWNAPLKKGMDQLVNHALEGFNAMPAKGLCNDCTADDLRELIKFMSSTQQASV